jgi:hypothetical protein
MAKILTNEGSVQYDHSMDHAVEFFSKAGSIFSKKAKGKKPFYANQTSALELFKAVWFAGDQEMAMKLLFWLRDCRGGAGNRSAFRDCLKWLAETDCRWVQSNIGAIPDLGRWDDLRTLKGTDAEAVANDIWAKAIMKKDGLACKWADRTDNHILKILRKEKVVKDIGEFRRLLAEGRKNVVERKMCSKTWNEIEYPHVPSVAMSRYTKAFAKNDETRFAKFKEKVQKGEVKINAGVLFPHDLVRTLKGDGDCEIADAQFNALPNWVGDSKLRIMTLCDSSGSMSSDIGGTVQAIDVSTSLSLYCSDRIPKESPFHRKFIQFCSESKLTDWSGMTFSEAYGCGKNQTRSPYGFGYGTGGVFDGACGGTQIDTALDMLLNHAKMFKATNEQMPNMILIISDMQFHGVPGGTEGKTVVEHCLEKWEKAGYDRPKIVYWNVSPCDGSPATVAHKDVGMVSGFSPSILEAIMRAEDFTAKGIMLKKLEKYKVNVPV